MLHHVTRQIRPAELDECVSFYRLLGFEEVPTPPGIGERAVWLERRGAQIHLMPSPDATADAGHIAVVLDAYDATLERLLAEGYEVERRREHWGSPRAYITDPAGNLVEVMARAPA